jgi:hypothetical protein
MPVIALLKRPDGIGAVRFQARNGPSLVRLPIAFAKRPVPAVTSTFSVATLVRQIATEWPSYHRKGRVDKTDPVYTLVTVDLPKALIPYVANYDNIIVEGSTGAGSPRAVNPHLVRNDPFYGTLRP